MPRPSDRSLPSTCHAVPRALATPWRAVMLAQALFAFGCSSTTVQTSPDAAADTNPDLPATDAPPTDAPPADTADAPPIGQDIPVVPMCGPRTEGMPFPPSSDCTAMAQRVDPAALCVDPTVCPVTAHVALRCGMTGGYGPWIVATRTGAAVLFATNQGGFRNTLYTLPTSGMPEARLLPSGAVGRLAVDTSGRPIVLENENPGVATVHERDGVWRRGQAASAGSDLLLATAGAFVDENNGYVSVYNVGGSASLATLRAGCWSSSPLPGMTQAFPNVAIDANARPWVAWWLYGATGPVLRLLDPDGRTHDVGTFGAGGLVGNAMPVLVADFADGRRAWPALADHRSDGPHVYTRGAADTAWRDRLLTPMMTAGMSNCPGGGSPPGSDPCGGLTRCTEQVRGVSRALGLARTADGTLWAAWASHDYEVDYTLSGGGAPGCTGGGGGGGIVPPRCMCNRTETTRRGGATVTLARVGDAAIATTARLRIDAPGPVPELAVTARGDTLHLVVWERAAAGTSLRYLAVDTRSIR